MNMGHDTDHMHLLGADNGRIEVTVNRSSNNCSGNAYADSNGASGHDTNDHSVLQADDLLLNGWDNEMKHLN